MNTAQELQALAVKTGEQYIRPNGDMMQIGHPYKTTGGVPAIHTYVLAKSGRRREINRVLHGDVINVAADWSHFKAV